MLFRSAQSFAERWARRGGLGLLALVRPLLFGLDRVFATRALHMLLRGVSRDRLDPLGEEYFHYVLKPQLKPKGVRKLKEWMASHGQVILVSQALDHVMQPLADFLGIDRLVANRLEFRDRFATGRLLEPVIRPRGGLALVTNRGADGRVSREHLTRDLGFEANPERLETAVIPAKRPAPKNPRPLVLFDHRKSIQRLSVRESLAGKHILLTGVTGFIGKVWLTHLLTDLPEVGKIYLLIRRQRSNTAQRRFERIDRKSVV